VRQYNQLSYDERIKIAQMHQENVSISCIARATARSKATIYRELKRNQAPPGTYWPDTAHRMARNRRHRGCIIDRDAALRTFITEKLCDNYWTPEQIAGYLSYRQKTLRSISHETIYAWLYNPKQRSDKLWKFLPRHKAKRGLKKSNGAGLSRIKNRVSIHARPRTAAGRWVFGNWEGDLMSCMRGSQHIVVLREKKTMFTIAARLPSKHADTTADTIALLMSQIPPQARKTMTFDNGGEFAEHQVLHHQLGIDVFFCDPYASWQKGGVENTNGRLRRDFPRSTDLMAMQQEDFDETIDNYNTTPRKSLKWLTPLQAFNNNLHRVALRT
jgi:IS30 family transposase